MPVVFRRDRHRELWLWIAEKVESWRRSQDFVTLHIKTMWPGWRKLKTPVINHCFACESAFMLRQKMNRQKRECSDACDFCPLQGVSCDSHKGLYKKYVLLHTYFDLFPDDWTSIHAEIARRIATAPLSRFWVDELARAKSKVRVIE